MLLRLMGRFKSLRYEDLEEVYNDGCLVLWEKMMDKEFKLMEKGMVGYLVRICRNIGMHYLRKVNEDIESLDRILERGYRSGLAAGAHKLHVRRRQRARRHFGRKD